MQRTITLVVAAIGLGFLSWILTKQFFPDAAPLPIHSTIGDFELASADDQPVTKRSLLGKVTVAHVFFTSCPFVCPKTIGEMKGVEQSIADPRFQVLSVSVDPERDSTAALRDYSEKHTLNRSNWLLTRAELPVLDGFMLKELKLGLGEKPDYHSTHWVLIDQQAQIRGYYRGSEGEERARLAADTGRLLAESGIN